MNPMDQLLQRVKAVTVSKESREPELDTHPTLPISYKPRCYLCGIQGPQALVLKQLTYGAHLVCVDSHACAERIKDSLWPERPRVVR